MMGRTVDVESGTPHRTKPFNRTRQPPTRTRCEEMRELAKGKVSRSMQLYPRLMLHDASVTILSMIGARSERASKAVMQNPNGNPLRASSWLFMLRLHPLSWLRLL